MAQTLTVTADFFKSDYVPQLCLFSGSEAKIDSVPVRIEYVQRRSSFEFGRSRRWQEVIRVPANKREHAAWSLWQALRPIATILVVFFFFIFCMQLAGDRDVNFMPQPRNWLAILWAGLLLTASGLLRWAAIWKIRAQLVRVEAAPERGVVLIHFPTRLQTVFQKYQDAFVSWQAAGCPVSTPKDRDDGWEDQASAGWDQATRREGLRP